MKFWIEFPKTGSQWDGRHHFYSVRQRAEWLTWAATKGADVATTTHGETK